MGSLEKVGIRIGEKEPAVIFEQILRESGALLTDNHFILKSGEHSEVYINKKRILEDERWSEAIGDLFVRSLPEDVPDQVTLVVGPATGGAIVAQWVTAALERWTGNNVTAVGLLKDEEGLQVISEDDKYVFNNANILIVDDICTTGSSIEEVQNLLTPISVVRVVGASVMVNRSPHSVSSEMFGIPFSSILDYPTPSYPEGLVPEKILKRSINEDYGYGAKYLRERRG